MATRQEIIKECLYCKKEFQKKGKYCSKECYGKANTGENNHNWKPKIKRICQVCGKNFEVIPYTVKVGWGKYCSHKCQFIAMGRNLLGSKHPSWKGGRIISDGYISIYKGKKQYQYEHVLKAEKALGRKLKINEKVHHINGVRADNRNCNLLICDNSYHAWVHHKMAQLYQLEHFRKEIIA